MIGTLYRLFHDDEAATAVEYAVMLAMVLMAVFGAVVTLGQSLNTSWQSSNTKLGAVNFGS
jgi:pilus assembly protein Flp/PilA